MKAFIAKVIELASAGLGEQETGFYTQYVEQIVPQALQELADRVAADPLRAHLLNKKLKLTLTEGVGNLSSAVDAATDAAVTILQTYPYLPRVFDINNDELEYMPHLYDLNRPHDETFGYYAIEAGQVHTRAKAGQVEGSNTGGPVVDMTGSSPSDPPVTPAVAGYDGTLYMIAPVLPTLDTLPASLENDAIALCVDKLQKNRLAMEAGQPGSQASKGQV